MEIKISLEKRHLGFLLLGIGIFVFAGFVWAYNPTMTGGNPVAFGHSADELHVNIGGAIKSLQQAIDDNDFAGAPTGDPGVQPWEDVTGGIAYTGGKVGIGSSIAPGRELTIRGNGDANGYIGLNIQSDASGGSNWHILSGATGSANPGALTFFRGGSGGGHFVTFDDNGNVGIGTQTPSTKLDVAGSISTPTVSSPGDLTLSASGAGGDVLIDTSGVNRLRVHPDGTVAVSNILNVGGSISTGAVGSPGDLTLSSSGTGGDVLINSNGATRMQIRDDGWVTFSQGIRGPLSVSNGYLQIPASASPPATCGSANQVPGAMYFDTSEAEMGYVCICTKWGAGATNWNWKPMHDPINGATCT